MLPAAGAFRGGEPRIYNSNTDKLIYAREAFPTRQLWDIPFHARVTLLVNYFSSFIVVMMGFWWIDIAYLIAGCNKTARSRLEAGVNFIDALLLLFVMLYRILEIKIRLYLIESVFCYYNHF